MAANKVATIKKDCKFSFDGVNSVDVKKGQEFTGQKADKLVFLNVAEWIVDKPKKSGKKDKAEK